MFARVADDKSVCVSGPDLLGNFVLPSSAKKVKEQSFLWFGALLVFCFQDTARDGWKFRSTKQARCSNSFCFH